MDSEEHTLSLQSRNDFFHFSFQGKDEEGRRESAGVSQEVTHFPSPPYDINEGENEGEVCSGGVLAQHVHEGLPGLCPCADIRKGNKDR